VSVYDQHGYRVKFDWGLRGALECGPGSTVVAVVDVLSFTTTVGVAVERGIEVLPYRWRDESAEAYAADRQAVLAVGRSEAGPGEVSLSPGTFRRVQGVERVVLPSPNGSTIAQAVAALGCNVLAVSLRNATAAALWAKDRIGAEGTVLAVASGEHWRSDGGLRPAVEDLWGAGAFLAALRAAGVGELSPEAMTASTAVAGDLAATASGRELIDAGYPEDVAIAGERDTSDVVPLLAGDRFRQA
jgi:2-phosphosulfolactate phosphatase